MLPEASKLVTPAYCKANMLSTSSPYSRDSRGADITAGRWHLPHHRPSRAGSDWELQGERLIPSAPGSAAIHGCGRDARKVEEGTAT